MGERRELTAHAKVNLTLEVLGKRADGFHEIRSVMQRISLADRLTIEPADRLTLACSDPALEGKQNLVWRAADLLRVECGVSAGAALHLEKRIPVSAGLGGGSSDCASALLGLDELWGLGLAQEKLMELGARLGSDVPFFLLESGCALAEGRGERLTALPPLPERWVVLLKPEVGISAGAAYGALTSAEWSNGFATSRWLAYARASGIPPEPFNALEVGALRAEPAAAAARRALLEVGARQAVMSGSGSTFFAVVEHAEAAHQMAETLREGGWREVWAARFVTL